MWGFEQGGDMILCFKKTRWWGEERSGEGWGQVRNDGGPNESGGSGK